MSATTSSTPTRRPDRIDTIAPAASAPATSRRSWQSVALAAGGLLFAAGNLLHPLQHNDAAYRSTTWEAAHLTIFASVPLLVLGLPALYRRLVPRVGRRLATISVAASVVGLIGIAPGSIIEAFVAPMIGHQGMEHLESGGLGVVNAVCGLAFLGGTMMLGWAAYRARLRPRWAGPVIIGSNVAMLGVMDATSATAGAVVIAATALFGVAIAALAAKA